MFVFRFVLYCAALGEAESSRAYVILREAQAPFKWYSCADCRRCD